MLPKTTLKKCLVRDAASQGVEVISLPELYSSHYFCQSEDVDNFALAEPLYSTSFIACFGKRIRRGNHCSVFRKKGWLESTTIAPTLLILMVRKGLYKMHIPDDPHFMKNSYFLLAI
jgi:N-carbamoylputrescine amidase